MFVIFMFPQINLYYAPQTNRKIRNQKSSNYFRFCTPFPAKKRLPLFPGESPFFPNKQKTLILSHSLKPMKKPPLTHY